MDFIINKTEKDNLINKIVLTEWHMFDKVINIGGRANCQDDEWTFYVMRYSQFNSLSHDTLTCYMNDLEIALATGRNLLEEKYAHMMEYTHPDYYQKNLKANLPEISEKKAEIINNISKIMMNFEEEFSREYPGISKKGRPSKGVNSSMVSSEVYLIGELKTYSEVTLIKFYDDVLNAKKIGKNLVTEIRKTTALLYGYKSLEMCQ